MPDALKLLQNLINKELQEADLKQEPEIAGAKIGQQVASDFFAIKT